MKRPLFVIGIAFFVTIWFAFFFSHHTALLFSAAAALSAFCCFLVRARFKRALNAGAVLLACSAAFAAYTLYIRLRIEPVQLLAGRTAVVEGLVTQVERRPGSVSCTVNATFVEYPSLPARIPLVIRSYDGFAHSEGDTFRCKVQLVAAPADSLWYQSRGISLIGQNVRDDESIPAGFYRYERALLRLRGILARNVYDKLPEGSADIVSAMVLGLKDNVSPEVYSAVGRSGTSHLLSVSGLHLSIITAFALGLLKHLRCPRRASAAIAIAFCFLFACLVGFGASIFRSFIMTALTLAGRLFSRRADSLTCLGLALLICSIVWPYWALSFGLWLSAGSTLGIILFASKMTDALYRRFLRGNAVIDRFLKWVLSGAAVSLAAYVFTLPVLLVMSGWISLVSPLANILVAPFVPVVMIGGILCAVVPGVPLPAQAIALATDLSARVIVRVSEIMGSLSFAIVAIDESYLLFFLAGSVLFAVLLFLFRADTKLVAYAAALLMVCFSAGDLTLQRANRDKFELISLAKCDTSILLRGDEAVLLGMPDAYETTYLLRYLNFRCVRAISAVIATNCDGQISSGMLRLAGAYPIDCIIGPNDAYTLGQLELAFPDCLVYSGGYATISLLGGADITTELLSDTLHIKAGKNEIVKINDDCDIIEPVDGLIQLYGGGVMLLPGSSPPAFEPLGGYLYGESRVLLEL